MARPRKEINKKDFESLCGIQCTKQEICDFFDVTDKTLNSWCKRTYNAGFSAVFAQKRGIGKISLRRKQWHLADTSASMALWLGKQYLGQRDNMDVTVGDAGALALEELEKMVKQDESETSGRTANT